MRFRASELAGVTGGRLSGPDVEVDGVAIDSRGLRPGALFVPIVGARDGHDFIADALAGGAAAYLSARGAAPEPAPHVEVDDTARSLLAIGTAARLRLPERVVGVTGSVGKTTVKDLTAAALGARFATWASERSFNNELGVPLTLANAPEGTEAVVVEMGARGPGHIALLCGLARPTIGVVTRVAAAHTELFGSLDEVARAKGELVEALPSAGTAVLNADDPRVREMGARTAAGRLLYSTASGRAGVTADLTAERVAVDEELRPGFRLVTPWGAADVRLAVRGEHNVANALAAAGAALAAGVGLEEAAAGLARATGSPSRMQLGRTAAGLLVLDDAYNANPASMEAALLALARLPVRRRVAVLGPMAELGPEGPAEHARLAELARSLGIELLTVGTTAYGGERALPDARAALAALGQLGPLGAGDAVLVKASRVAGLETVAAELLGAPPEVTGAG